MLIFEFAGHGPDPILIKLVAVLSNLKGRIDNREERSNWTLDELISYLRDNEVILAHDDMYELIKEPPLSNIISNIQGEEVIFKDNDSSPEGEDDAEKKKDVVKQMAKRAVK